MTPPDTVPIEAPGVASTPPPTAFGKGFVLDAWYFVALSRDAAPASLKRHDLLGQPVLVGRTRAGQIYAMRDICPHRAAPLSAGKLVDRPGEGETVECPYHGWRFRTDGVCAAIPSLVEDQTFETERIRVRTYPARESQGLIFVWMASDPRNPSEPDHEPPAFPGVVGGEAKRVEAEEIHSHIDHAVVGLIPPTPGALEPREQGFTMVRHTPPSNGRIDRILGWTSATEISFRLPGYRWAHFQLGEKQVLALTCLTPLSETRTRITRIFWSDHRAFALARPLLRVRAGLEQDPASIRIDDSDELAGWYRQLKREWTKSRAEGRDFSNPVVPAALRRTS